MKQALLWLKTLGIYDVAVSFMNWTSTQHAGWAEQCREFASKRMPFRLDHISGPKEVEFCDNLCAEQNYRQVTHGSSVVFTPGPTLPHK